MTRFLAIALAFLMTVAAVSSACVAQDSAPIGFTLSPGGRPDQVQAHFDFDPRGHSNWSTGLSVAELAGFDAAAFRSGGSRPLQFAIRRDSGRLACAGHGGNSRASGTCTFTADPAYGQLLASNGTPRPNPHQWMGLFAVNVRSDLIRAISAARYPAPSADVLMQLAAVGVTANYIRDMRTAGYRPGKLDTLVELRALDITPAWIGDLSRIGYGGLPADELVQLKALGITADYIRGFQAAGYPHLSATKLVEMKAVGVDPAFARAMRAKYGTVAPDRLVELRVLGDMAGR